MCIRDSYISLWYLILIRDYVSTQHVYIRLRHLNHSRHLYHSVVSINLQEIMRLKLVFEKGYFCYALNSFWWFRFKSFQYISYHRDDESLVYWDYQENKLKCKTLEHANTKTCPQFFVNFFLFHSFLGSEMDLKFIESQGG